MCECFYEKINSRKEVIEEMPTIRSRYDSYKSSDGHTYEEPSITQQQFKNDADINYIVQMYDSTGVYPNAVGTDQRSPMFGDFANLPENAQDAYNQILDARHNFDRLPLEIRQRFNYDPAAFLEFVQNPNNIDELVAMGLATKAEVAPPESVNNSPEEGQPK